MQPGQSQLELTCAVGIIPKLGLGIFPTVEDNLEKSTVSPFIGFPSLDIFSKY